MKINTTKLELARAKSGMTQDKLAEVAGIAKMTIPRIKRGSDVSTLTVGKIAKALGVDPIELLED